MIVYQMKGLAIACAIQALFLGVARLAAGKYWFPAWLLVVATVSSIMISMAFFSMPWMPVSVLVALFVLMIAMFVVRLRHSEPSERNAPTSEESLLRKDDKKRPHRTALGWAAWFMLIALLFDVLYAAMPFYRYDQWNYHLTISKIVTQFGALPKDISDFTLYFTGGYEYLLALGRVFSSDDVVQQSFADALGWSNFVIAVVGIVSMWSTARGHAGHWRGFLLILTVGLALFGIQDHMGLINAKPDTFHLPAAALGLIAMEWLRTERPHRRALSRVERHWWSAALGFAITIGMVFKISYAHFSLALVGAMTFGVAARWLVVSWGYVALGVAIGTVLSLPVFIKNAVFFGNPVYPVQLVPSRLWTPAMADFWYSVTLHARDAKEFALIQLDQLRAVPTRLLMWLPAFALAWLYDEPFKNVGEWRLGKPGPVAAALVFYLLLWPLFLHAWISPRFVMPFYAFAVIAIASAMMTLVVRGRHRQMVFAAFIPVVITSSLDIHTLRTRRALTQDLAEFYPAERRPEQAYPISQLVNADRAQRFGHDLSYTSHAVLTDLVPSVFFDMVRFNVAASELDVLVEKAEASAGRTLTPREALAALNISYLLVTESGDEYTKRWPRKWQPANVITPNDERISLPGGVELWVLKN